MVQHAGMDVGMQAREVWLDLLALLWPTECLGCGVADRDCCDACLAAVRSPPIPIERDIGLPCYAAGAYAGPVRAMLVLYKHAGRAKFVRDLAPRLRAPLAEALQHCTGPQAPVVVAVPSRASRVRERGYRHVELLCTDALRGWGVPVLRLAALRALRGRTAQVGLNAQARERNARRITVRRACRKVLVGREVIVIDDVVTTGATLRAAVEALETAGARVVAAVALCAVLRLDQSVE